MARPRQRRYREEQEPHPGTKQPREDAFGTPVRWGLLALDAAREGREAPDVLMTWPRGIPCPWCHSERHLPFCSTSGVKRLTEEKKYFSDSPQLWPQNAPTLAPKCPQCLNHSEHLRYWGPAAHGVKMGRMYSPLPPPSLFNKSH